MWVASSGNGAPAELGEATERTPAGQSYTLCRRGCLQRRHSVGQPRPPISVRR